MKFRDLTPEEEKAFSSKKQTTSTPANTPQFRDPTEEEKEKFNTIKSVDTTYDLEGENPFKPTDQEVEDVDISVGTGQQDDSYFKKLMTPARNRYKETKYEMDKAKIVDTNVERVQSIIGAVKEVTGKYSDGWKDIGASVGYNTEEVDTFREWQKESTIKELESQGYEVDYRNDKYVLTIDGKKFEVEPEGMIPELGRQKGKIGSAIAGGTALASKFPAAHPAAKIVTFAVGAAAASMIGEYTDQEVALSELNMELTPSERLSKMSDASLTIFLEETLGAKGIELGLKVGKFAISPITKIVSNIKKGNVGLAMDYIKELYNLTDEDLDGFVDKLYELQGPVRGRTKDEQRATAFLKTQKEGRDFIELAKAENSVAGTEASIEITERMKAVKDKINEFKSNEYLPATHTKQSMKDYEDTVHRFYGNVVDTADSLVDNYSFNINDSEAVKFFEELKVKYEGEPDSVTAIQNYIDNLIGDQKGAKFGFKDLVEVRKALNKAYHTPGIKKIAGLHKNKIDAMLKNVDEEIEHIADTYIPNADKWKADWKLANSKWKEMLDVREQEIYTQLMDKDLSQKELTDIVKSHLSKEGDSFFTVFNKLSKDTRTRVEGDILDTIVGKISDGDSFALDFSAAAEAVNKLNLTSPEARAVKSVINEYSKVFKGDPTIIKARGGVKSPKDLSTIAEQLGGVFRRTMVNKIANLLKRRTETVSEKAVRTMIKYTEDAFKNPLDGKIRKKLNSLPEDMRPENWDPETKEAMSAWQQVYKENDLSPDDFEYAAPKSSAPTISESQKTLEVEVPEIAEKVEKQLGVRYKKRLGSAKMLNSAKANISTVEQVVESEAKALMTETGITDKATAVKIVKQKMLGMISDNSIKNKRMIEAIKGVDLKDKMLQTLEEISEEAGDTKMSAKEITKLFAGWEGLSAKDLRTKASLWLDHKDSSKRTVEEWKDIIKS